MDKQNNSSPNLTAPDTDIPATDASSTSSTSNVLDTPTPDTPAPNTPGSSAPINTSFDFKTSNISSRVAKNQELFTHVSADQYTLSESFSNSRAKAGANLKAARQNITAFFTTGPLFRGKRKFVTLGVTLALLLVSTAGFYLLNRFMNRPATPVSTPEEITAKNDEAAAKASEILEQGGDGYLEKADAILSAQYLQLEAAGKYEEAFEARQKAAGTFYASAEYQQAAKALLGAQKDQLSPTLLFQYYMGLADIYKKMHLDEEAQEFEKKAYEIPEDQVQGSAG